MAPFIKIDPRAVKFWKNFILAMLAEVVPDDMLCAALEDLAKHFHCDLLKGLDYGMPDIGAVRRMLGLSIDEVAARIGQTPGIVMAIERGWELPPVSARVRYCACLGIAYGSLYHDEEFVLHPFTAAYAAYLNDEMAVDLI